MVTMLVATIDNNKHHKGSHPEAPEPIAGGINLRDAFWERLAGWEFRFDPADAGCFHDLIGGELPTPGKYPIGRILTDFDTGAIRRRLGAPEVRRGIDCRLDTRVEINVLCEVHSEWLGSGSMIIDDTEGAHLGLLEATGFPAIGTRDILFADVGGLARLGIHHSPRDAPTVALAEIL